MPENAHITLPGTVEKILSSPSSDQRETVQISVETPHDLYRHMRIDNTLTDKNGDKVSLKLGSSVEVTISAEADSTTVQTGSPIPTKG